MGHVRRGPAPHGDLVAHFHGDRADAVVGTEVHAAEVIGEPLVDGPVPLGVAAVENDRVGRVLLLHPVELFGNDPVGLIPADGFKFPLAPLSHALQGRPDAVLAVDIAALGGTLCAELAVVVGMAGRALHPDDLPVLDVAVQAAVVAGAADGAQGVPDLDAGVLPGDLCFQFFLQFSQEGPLPRI